MYTNKIETYFQGLSDQELSILVEEINKPHHADDSPIREAINIIYRDDVGIYMLRIIELVFPLLNEIHSRWKNTSK